MWSFLNGGNQDVNLGASLLKCEIACHDLATVRCSTVHTAALITGDSPCPCELRGDSPHTLTPLSAQYTLHDGGGGRDSALVEASNQSRVYAGQCWDCIHRTRLNLSFSIGALLIDLLLLVTV